MIGIINKHKKEKERVIGIIIFIDAIIIAAAMNYSCNEDSLGIEKNVLKIPLKQAITKIVKADSVGLQIYELIFIKGKDSIPFVFPGVFAKKDIYIDTASNPPALWLDIDISNLMTSPFPNYRSELIKRVTISMNSIYAFRRYDYTDTTQFLTSMTVQLYPGRDIRLLKTKDSKFSFELFNEGRPIGHKSFSGAFYMEIPDTITVDYQVVLFGNIYFSYPSR